MPGLLFPFVEGQGEVAAVPILLRRLLARLGRADVQVARPYRVHRYRLVRQGELERRVISGLRDRGQVTAILILLDADDERRPAAVEEELVQQCRAIQPIPAAAVLACREFESWFLGCKDALRGVCGIRADAQAPPDPEAIRGAKERLSRNMQGPHYSEVRHQPSLAQRMDIDLTLERCPSFRRLETELRRLLAEMAAPPQP